MNDHCLLHRIKNDLWEVEFIEPESLLSVNKFNPSFFKCKTCLT